MAFRLILAAMILCLPATAAVAGTSCTADFSSDLSTGDSVFDARLEEVSAQTVHFIANDASKGCPSQASSCQTDDVVAKGDKVVVTHAQDGYACAIHLGKSPLMASGWLPVSALAEMDADVKWGGRWIGSVLDTEISIEEQQGGTLEFKGTLGEGQDAEPQFAATVRPEGANAQLGYDRAGLTQMAFSQAVTEIGQCAVKLRQLGPYLAVQDNGNCAGLNNSFSGVYSRSTAQAGEDKPKPDASGLRPSYTACLDASGGVTSDMEDCVGAEFEFQDARLNTAYQALRDRLDQASKLKLRDEERLWMANRDKSCADDAGGGTGQAVSANDCSLELTAKRAAELESR